MSTVVCIETPAAHVATVHNQHNQEVNRSMTDVLKLAAFNLTRAHRASGHPALERLDVGFLVQAKYQLLSGCQLEGVLVAPQDGSCLPAKVLIKFWRLPIS